MQFDTHFGHLCGNFLPKSGQSKGQNKENLNNAKFWIFCTPNRPSFKFPENLFIPKNVDFKKSRFKVNFWCTSCLYQAVLSFGKPREVDSAPLRKRKVFMLLTWTFSGMFVTIKSKSLQNFKLFAYSDLKIYYSTIENNMEQFKNLN